MFYNINGKTWLQASPYMFRGLRNAIEGRYEKYNVLVGLALILAAIGSIALAIRGLLTLGFDASAAIGASIAFAVLILTGLHWLGIRGSHKGLIESFTSRKDPYRRLIPEEDVVFRFIMFPEYLDYLTGRKRADINVGAWKILENYVREALSFKEIIDFEINDPDCSELETIKLQAEYELRVLQLAGRAGTKIAAELELDTGSFFKDRMSALKLVHRTLLVSLLEKHKVMDEEAEAILELLD